MRDIEERVQSLAETFASPVGGQGSGEKAHRETLCRLVCSNRDTGALLTVWMVRRKLARIITKLRALSEQCGLLKFLNNIDHASALNSFVQDIAHTITDYQVRVTKSTVSVILCLDRHPYSKASARTWRQLPYRASLFVHTPTSPFPLPPATRDHVPRHLQGLVDPHKSHITDRIRTQRE